MLPPAASLDRTRGVDGAGHRKALMKNPAVAERRDASPASISCRGAQKTNSGVSFVTLKDWSERTDPQLGRAQSGAGASAR